MYIYVQSVNTFQFIPPINRPPPVCTNHIPRTIYMSLPYYFLHIASSVFTGYLRRWTFKINTFKPTTKMALK